jgi:hypothetical protein
MRIWGLAGLTALGLAASLATAQPPRGKPATTNVEQPGWWSGLFGGKPKEEAKKPATPAVPTMTTEAKIAEHERLVKAYQRREAVCDRLREIALETNDAALEEEAKRLLEMAMELYRQRSSKLLGVASLKMEDEKPEPEKPARYSAASLRNGPLPPRLRNSSLEPESYHRSAGVREGER